jgi:hypothetical protein
MAENEIESMSDTHPIGLADQPLDTAAASNGAAATRDAALPVAGASEPRASATRGGLAEPPADPAPAREAVAEPPADLDAALRHLAPWQARYALALFELGGMAALARKRCNVSTHSVSKAQIADPDFAEACMVAVNRSAELEEAAMWHGGILGNLTPHYQKGRIVGYGRVRNAKDAEALLRLRGRLTESSTQSPPKVAESQVAGIVAATLATLSAARTAQQSVER